MRSIKLFIDVILLYFSNFLNFLFNFFSLPPRANLGGTATCHGCRGATETGPRWHRGPPRHHRHGNHPTPSPGPKKQSLGSACEACEAGAAGPQCALRCPADCGGHGRCDDGVAGTGRCACDGGWGGSQPGAEGGGRTRKGGFFLSLSLGGGGWAELQQEGGSTAIRYARMGKAEVSDR